MTKNIWFIFTKMFLTKIFAQFLTKIFAQFLTKNIWPKIFAQFLTKIFRQIRSKIFGQITQLSKVMIPCLTDRVDSRVLPKWAELKNISFFIHHELKSNWKLLLLFLVFNELLSIILFCFYGVYIDCMNRCNKPIIKVFTNYI